MSHTLTIQEQHGTQTFTIDIYQRDKRLSKNYFAVASDGDNHVVTNSGDFKTPTGALLEVLSRILDYVSPATWETTP